MLRYFKKVDKNPSSSDVSSDKSTPEAPIHTAPAENVIEQSQVLNEISDFSELPSDPGKRIKISCYHPNIREKVIRHYLLKGPCQPKLDNFPQTLKDDKWHRFNRDWYNMYNWIEYSIEKDAAFCLYCYLCKNEIGQGGGDTFTTDGFDDWKYPYKLLRHVGDSTNSAHNKAYAQCMDLLNEKQHIEPILDKITDEAKIEYRTRLVASIDCIRWLLKQGLAFRVHDESEGSNNQGNFLELLKFLADHNEDVRKVALKNAPANLKLIAPLIQKDIVNACATETTNAILKEIGGGRFSILLDDSRDVSVKEQMDVVLRFVDKKGCVLERILGFRHVECTSSKSLRDALVNLLNSHGLSILMVRGQGYDGASNMKGEFHGLKARILEENQSAYYVHCFAHQLQLALVATAKNHIRICELFVKITSVVNVVGGSCKRRDSLREKQVDDILDALENEEITSGRGLNQERTVIRSCDTRWSSHYGTLLSLIHLFKSVISVLEDIKKDGVLYNQRGEASRLIRDMECFDFVFDLHLMRSILGITNDLCQALQRRDQDIVNAMSLVDTSKERLQTMRASGFDSLIEDVSVFCVKHKIEVPDMEGLYTSGKRRRNMEEMTNSHRYRVEFFNTVIDMQWQELHCRFDEVSTELLLCVSCLNPSNSFQAFNKQKLVRLAEFYPKDFEGNEILALSDQFENFLVDMRSHIDISSMKGIGDITQKMVETRRDLAFPLVYRLMTLVLLLSVSTATVERAFSAMKIVKTRLRNRMGDGLMNDNLVVYIEKDIFNSISNEDVIHRFQTMANRRGRL